MGVHPSLYPTSRPPGTAASVPVDVYQGEHHLRNLIQSASKHHIPSGRRPLVIPQLPADATHWIRERDNLRAADPSSPELATLNNRIQMAVRKSKTAKWKEFMATFDHNFRPQN